MAAYLIADLTLTDLTRTRAELLAENALLRQQLIILRRQVKRPACTRRMWPSSIRPDRIKA